MQRLSRRRLLAASAAVVAPGVSTARDQGLAGSAARTERFFGCAIDIPQLQAEADLQATVLDECAWLAPELALKWAMLEPEAGLLKLEGADAIAAFARRNAKTVRGHTLLWHRSVPAWGVEALRGGDWGAVTRYFSSIIPRYGDVVPQWDVVNEPVAPDGGSGLRQNVFLQAFGPDYIARALEAARTYAPKAQLFIAEYGLEHADADQSRKRERIVALVEDLKRKGAPLDGLALQSHLDLRRGDISASGVGALCDAVAGLGLRLVVSELDVKERDYAAPVEVRDREVADVVRRYLDVVLVRPAVDGVVTWGLSDRHSWLTVEADDLRRFPGAWRDGNGPGLNRGLPLDATLRRKPMYEAIRAAFDAAPARGAQNRR